MRSRYTAYCKGDVDHLLRTHLHPQPDLLRQELSTGIRRQKWLSLVVHDSGQDGDAGFVSFTATYVDGGRMDALRERSEFVRRQGRWLYLTGESSE